MNASDDANHLQVSSESQISMNSKHNSCVASDALNIHVDRSDLKKTRHLKKILIALGINGVFFTFILILQDIFYSVIGSIEKYITLDIGFERSLNF